MWTENGIKIDGKIIIRASLLHFYRDAMIARIYSPLFLNRMQIKSLLV